MAYNMRRLARNVLMDLKYGGFVGGTVKSPFARLGIQDTASTDYEALPAIFRDAIGPSDVLVDIGCGKGRVINWWLSRGLDNRIIGIELDPEVASATSRRLRSYRNVTIVCGDALANLPEEGSIFYLFNPFNELWVRAFRDRIAGLITNAHPIRIFYYNCVHLRAFEEDSRWVVNKIEMRDPFHRLAIIKPTSAGPELQKTRSLTTTTGVIR